MTDSEYREYLDVENNIFLNTQARASVLETFSSGLFVKYDYSVNLLQESGICNS